MTATNDRSAAGTAGEDLEAAAHARARQGAVGLGLALVILGTWALIHVAAVFFYTWGWHSLITAPLIAIVQCWLYVGMFIVAHDCMHGSLVPFRPQVNRAIGQLCLLLYAGFSFDQLNRKHHLHHRHSGTEGDPDFDARPPHGFWRWYLSFMFEYFCVREALFLTAVVGLYLFVFGVNYANLLAFWTIPAIASSLQLFVFGTYLPHRPGALPFVDRHRARSNGYGWWVSLMTCFHFGYHHEHHLFPSVPWWRLPEARRSVLGKAQG